MQNSAITNKLIENTLNKTVDNKGKTTVSQEANIDGKRVKITLNFTKEIDDTEASQAMRESFEKSLSFNFCL